VLLEPLCAGLEEFGFFKSLKGNDTDPSGQRSVFSSFKRVIASKMRDELATFKYEIYLPGLGKMDTQFWSNFNEPIQTGRSPVKTLKPGEEYNHLCNSGTGNIYRNSL